MISESLSAPADLTGAQEAVDPTAMSPAGYAPIFYAVSLRELHLAQLLLSHPTDPADVDVIGPGPYLPTPLHILFALPDERVQCVNVPTPRTARAPAHLSHVARLMKARETNWLGHLHPWLPRLARAALRRQDGDDLPAEFRVAADWSNSTAAVLGGVAAERVEQAGHGMTELMAAVHEWQLPFCLLLLAHSADPAKLAGVVDAWGRNAAHMAVRPPDSAGQHGARGREPWARVAFLGVSWWGY